MVVATPESWRERYRTPSLGFPQWSAQQPDRLVFISNEGGTTQAWTAELVSGRRYPITDQRIGVEDVLLTPDGVAAVWWSDETGDESGEWVTTSLDGDPSTQPLLPIELAGWSQGIALAGSTIAVALTDDTTYRLYVSIDDEPPRLLREGRHPLGLGREWESTGGGLSLDGSLVCYRHTDDGDMLHFGLRVVDARSGDEVDNLVDDGLTLKVASWSPVSGDQRLAIIHERDGIERPALWDPIAQSRRNYPLDLPGPVDVVDWWPDASALLLLHEHAGRSQLYVMQLRDGSIELVCDPKGWISGAAVRPDGTVWLREESAERPPVVRTVAGQVILAPPESAPPAGRPHESRHFLGPEGQLTHMLLTLPEGSAPFPVVMMVHGGPEWAYPDDFDPWEQALVDHGYAVAKVNYRGSTGSTVAWRTAIHGGNIGFPEVADVVAGLDYLVEEGLADPRRAAIEGWSWGGYVALLAAGRHPTTFAAVIGGIPVGDSVMTHEDCSPPQQAYDLAIMGGSPVDRPDLYAERSPITYVDQVAAPVLMIAGEHDSACPIRQVRHYASRLRDHGGQVELHVYDAGHHANSIEEKLRHADLELEFLRKHLDVTGK
jgi:dienelactone hydrolase